MRILKILLAVLALMFLAMTTSAFAAQIRIALTQGNVESACGSSYHPLEGGGGMCTRPCYGGTTCYFRCGDGGTDCWGVVLPARLTDSGSPVQPLPGATGLTTIPCDPVFCKIFCGGKPYCTFGTTTFQPVQAIGPKIDLPPPSLVTPVPAGNVAAPAKPAGVLTP